MAFFWYARCDNAGCGDVLQADDEDELRAQGWTVVEVGEDRYDFCSLPCLTAWSGSSEAIEAVEKALSEAPEVEED